MTESKKNILVQLDPDPHPCVFDAVVAVDGGAEVMFRHGNVKPDQVRGLVQGAMFTRGPDDLRHTAFFIGGNDVPKAEALFDAVTKTFFDPFRCSILFDPAGCNTTSVATVWALSQQETLSNHTTVVLGGTGPVGQRVALLMAKHGAKVYVLSRSVERAQETCRQLEKSELSGELCPLATGDDGAWIEQTSDASTIVAAGAAGVQLLSLAQQEKLSQVKYLVDLNAVPPAGIEGVGLTDFAKTTKNAKVYGPLGIGGYKMKLHKAAIGRLFEANNIVLDAEELYSFAQDLLVV